MKERPILFSAPMVRAILDGRKTQTRRVVKPQPFVDSRYAGGHAITVAKRFFTARQTAGEISVEAPYVGTICPYGNIGDRIWVRETWQGPLVDDFESYHANPDKCKKPEFCEYAADGGPAPEFVTVDDNLEQRWIPSIHMPRWASRILLEVTDVRVERLNDISDEDAIAEGVRATGDGAFHIENDTFRAPDPVECYARLWESINGAGSWINNPWVWVVEFKRSDLVDAANTEMVVIELERLGLKEAA